MDIKAEVGNAGGDSNSGFISHDSISQDISYRVGGQPHFHNKAHHKGFETHEAHPPANHQELETVGIKLRSPLYLANFQDFVAQLVLREGVVRAKGIICFTEFRRWRYEFHLSGVQRIDVEQDRIWETEPLIQLVIIGKNLDKLLLSQTLEEATKPPPINSKMAGEEEKIRKEIESDADFELEPPDPQLPGSLVFGLVETSDMRLHGFYSSDLNLELGVIVNSLRLPFLLVPHKPEGSTKAMLHFALCAQESQTEDSEGASEIRGSRGSSDTTSSGGSSELSHWAAIREAATKLMISKSIPSCKCGF